jgi:hypothetical protein
VTALSVTGHGARAILGTVIVFCLIKILPSLTSSLVHQYDAGKSQRRFVRRFYSDTLLTRYHDTIAYKNKGLKADELRRRREDQQVEIRKQKREENISKRRNLLPSGGGDSDDEYGPGGGDSVVSHVRILILS